MTVTLASRVPPVDCFVAVVAGIVDQISEFLSANAARASQTEREQHAVDDVGFPRAVGSGDNGEILIKGDPGRSTKTLETV